MCKSGNKLCTCTQFVRLLNQLCTCVSSWIRIKIKKSEQIHVIKRAYAFICFWVSCEWQFRCMVHDSVCYHNWKMSVPPDRWDLGHQIISCLWLHLSLLEVKWNRNGKMWSLPIRFSCTHTSTRAHTHTKATEPCLNIMTTRKHQQTAGAGEVTD